MSIEQKQQKNVRFEGIKKTARKAAIPALVGAGILFPTAVYTDSALDESPQKRSEEISDFLDNRQTEIVEGVLMTAGIALTVNGHLRGRKYDERKLHALRITGPALLTVAAGSAFINSQTTINYAIPAGLTLAGTYAIAATNIIDTFERTRDKALRTSTVAAGAGIVATGATIFLAAADKL